MMYNKLRLAILAASIISLSALVRPSLAVPAVFFDRDDSTGFMTSFPHSLAEFNVFTGSLASFGVDNINTAVGFDPVLSFGATGITAVAHGTLAQSAPGFMIGAQALLEADAAIPNSPAIPTTFDFNTPIRSFGLYVIQGGDGANNNPTTFRLKNTATNTFTDVSVPVGPGWGTDNAFFVGLTDTVPFNEVQILESIDLTDGMLYDNVVAGGAVPEPGSLLLMVLGGACALARRFRRS